MGPRDQMGALRQSDITHNCMATCGDKNMRQFVLPGVILASLAAAPAAAEIRIEIIDPVVVARIDNSTQRMQVSVDGKPVYSWKVSTGMRGYSTPVGDYAPYRMHTMWYSRQYGYTPMPHAVFFNEGIAVHGTNSTGHLGRPASHGCVRLHPANAKTFFKLILEHGRARTQISVTGDWSAKKKKISNKKLRKNRKKKRQSRRKRRNQAYN